MPRYKIVQVVPTECTVEVDAASETHAKEQLDGGLLDHLTWQCETDFRNILATTIGTAHT